LFQKYESHNGILDFPAFEEFNGLDKEFKNGAIVMLTFNLGEMK
jgi:hypothetical protein